MQVKGERILKFFLLILSITGVAGSFTLSLSGNIPCIYCWISRMSIIMVAILSLLSLYSSSRIFPLFISLISIPSIVSASVLLRNDLFPSPICSESSPHCFTPLFMGIHASVYAFFISVTLFFISSFLFYKKLRARKNSVSG